MTEEIDFQLDIAKEQMQEIIMHLENVLGKIRAGKANPQMLRTVMVDYYGVSTPLVQSANVSTPDAQTIFVQPFDKSLITEIEQAIVDANLGFTPSNNGERVIINVPPLTEDRRRDLAKQAKVEIENAKVKWTTSGTIASIGEPWDSSTTYAIGDYVTDGGKEIDF